MYGMVNVGLQQHVKDRYGDDVWQSAVAQSGVDGDVFAKFTSYPDMCTGQLLAAASELVGVPPAEMMEDFGEYWVLFVADEGYGPLLDIAGENLWDVLHNLDAMHARVGLTFPELQPPSFSCTDVTPNSLRLQYFSDRDGLAPLVVGCLKGLAIKYGEPVEIKHVVRRSDGADHDEFVLTRTGS